MVDVSGAFCNGSQVVAAAGSSYSVAYNDHMASGIVQVQGLINAMTRFDWITAITNDTVSSGGKAILNETASALVGNKAIVFDMNNYPNLILAEDMINVNRDIALRNLSILRDQKTQAYLTGS